MRSTLLGKRRTARRDNDFVTDRKLIGLMEKMKNILGGKEAPSLTLVPLAVPRLGGGNEILK